MEKYTFDQLMEMEKDEIEKIQSKMWCVRDILRNQNNFDGRFEWTVFDIRELLIRGVCPAVGVIGGAYLLYRGIKYYSDKKFTNQICGPEIPSFMEEK